MNPSTQEILACPHCKGRLRSVDGSFVCEIHGVVANLKFGVADFLVGRDVMPAAADGAFSLLEDEEKAQKLFEQLPRRSFRELQAILAANETPGKPNVLQGNAVERFNRNYARMEEEIGLDAGQSILNKVNPYLAEKNLAPIGGEVALEAGGGHGLHLPTFAKIFETVVFLDCSLVNLVMGRKLAQEAGVEAQIVFVRGDATALPFDDKGFDLVHEAGIIEHVSEPAKLISEALRVLSEHGTYICLSPNRYPISPEPHFRLPLFGLFPRALRKQLIKVTRGVDSEKGTDLRSLGQLKLYFREAGEGVVEPYFLPRYLTATTRNSFIRTLVFRGFKTRSIGAMLSLILNKLLLPIMPYHIVVISRDGPAH